MKEKIFGIVTFIVIVSSVFANTVILHKNISEIYDAVNSIEITEGDCDISKAYAVEAFHIFRKKELFIGLTVNHDDLSNIENDFSELIGFLSVGDAKGATVAKNRLADSLGHLRRLSGFNIDAII